MNFPPQIRTVENFNEYHLKEKGSSFISQIFHVESAEQAIEILNSTRKKFYDATHNCYAWKLVDGTFKYSDDGEPSGSAGIRIFNAMENEELVNQLIIVTRYFGGTKLGVGLLGRTYFTAAKKVIESSKISVKKLYQKLIIETDFSQTSNIHHLLNQNNAKIVEENYSDKVVFVILIIPANIASVIKFLDEKLHNLAKIEEKEEFEYL
jgi:uncharacterized YigZ family protein